MGRAAALVFCLWTALTAAAPLAHAQGMQRPAEPDAVVSLTEGQIAAGIGFSWGRGVLSFRGRDYPVRVTGLSAGDVGIARAEARGKVYGLTKVEDFDGTYTAYTVGSTIGGGGQVATMRNQNGVMIDLVTTTQGLKLTLSASGVSMRIEPPASR
jgi:hypothetical protein